MICPFLRHDTRRFCLARQDAGRPAVVRQDDPCESTGGRSYDSCGDYHRAVWEGMVPPQRGAVELRAESQEETPDGSDAPRR